MGRQLFLSRGEFHETHHYRGALGVGDGSLRRPASADQPVQYYNDWNASGVVTGICDFDFDIYSALSTHETDFFDKDGVLTRIFIHVEEQDTFTGPNGVPLQGLKFNFNIEGYVDAEGNTEHWYADGLVEKVRLPDGTLFISAGRLDFVLHPGVEWVLSPDSGNPGNIDAFCKAMSE